MGGSGALSRLNVLTMDAARRVRVWTGGWEEGGGGERKRGDHCTPLHAHCTLIARSIARSIARWEALGETAKPVENKKGPFHPLFL